MSGIGLEIWIGFGAFILGMLALDLGVFRRNASEVGAKEALTWSGVWIGIALLFNALIYLFWNRIQPESQYTNSEASMAFFAGYVIEKALSVDNIFVIASIFGYFAIPPKYQHRVLFWGIIGALVFRAVFIAVGSSLLTNFHWMAIVFGVLLVLTGIKLVYSHGKQTDHEKNPVIRVFRKLMPVTTAVQDEKFFKRINGKLWATPLFVTLLLVEFTDVVFAVDSIPAIFAITQNPFIIFTSNVFAILGLRSLYFAISGLLSLVKFLHYGLAVILVFVGVKMIYSYWAKFPIVWSLAIICTILIATVLASLRSSARQFTLEKPS